MLDLRLLHLGFVGDLTSSHAGWLAWYHGLSSLNGRPREAADLVSRVEPPAQHCRRARLRSGCWFGIMVLRACQPANRPRALGFWLGIVHRAQRWRRISGDTFWIARRLRTTPIAWPCTPTAWLRAPTGREERRSRAALPGASGRELAATPTWAPGRTRAAAVGPGCGRWECELMARAPTRTHARARAQARARARTRVRTRSGMPSDSD